LKENTFAKMNRTSLFEHINALEKINEDKQNMIDSLERSNKMKNNMIDRLIIKKNGGK